jgi:glutaredoxin
MIMLTLLVREGCHLCEDAREAIRTTAPGAVWQEVDVDSDPELRADWGDMVPVLLSGEQCIGYWRLEPARIRQALGLR